MVLLKRFCMKEAHGSQLLDPCDPISQEVCTKKLTKKYVALVTYQ